MCSPVWRHVGYANCPGSDQDNIRLMAPSAISQKLDHTRAAKLYFVPHMVHHVTWGACSRLSQQAISMQIKCIKVFTEAAL